MITKVDVDQSPLDEIFFDFPGAKKIRLFLKRDDLIHPVIEGNKFRKLKYNLLEILNGDYKLIESFGGAYSNHLLAVSEAGRLLDLPTRGYVNGIYADHNNITLTTCRGNGMELIFLNKAEYKARSESINDHDEFIFTLPEGGSNDLALKGSGEIMDEILLQIPDTTHVICPLGTGGTIAGMVSNNSSAIQLIAVPVLKMDTFKHLNRIYPAINFSNLEIWDDYHFGGYAKISDKLIGFIRNWFTEKRIVIDPIYNGKALFGLFDKVSKGHFLAGSRIVYVHTGGSQGILGMNARFGLGLPVKKE